jgi:mannosyl-oligosaccharide glucosidase
MSATGYMAREQIRGAEAESKVPSKFIMQNKLMANPPTLIFALRQIMNYYKNNFETQNLKKMSAFLKKCQDKFSSWYEWFEIYQRSSDRKSYQWYGRTNEHNLASGLDDFPRGLSPNLYEKHLDLNIWIIELLKTLRNLSEIFDYELSQHFTKRIEKMEKELRVNFYDNKKNILADYLGPQFKLIESANFNHPVPPVFWRGDGKCGAENLNSLGLPSECNPYSDMPCCSEFGWCGNSNAHCRCEKCKRSVKLEERNLEKENIFNPHVGYVNLYPIMFGLLKKEDSAFRNLLNLLKDEEILNSPYGIRSLSKSDLLYHTGEDYWRGNIWVNLNYLTLKGLKLYYHDDQESMQIYEEIRAKLIKTIYNNWLVSGMFYEQYSDVNGEGLRARPFNGWSSLVLEILSERYEE